MSDPFFEVKIINEGSVQFTDFGVITSENTVTGGHSGVGRNHAVIGARDRNASSAHTRAQ